MCVCLKPYRIFNTWMGDFIKVAMLKRAMEEVRRENMLALAVESGDVLLGGLKALEVSDGGGGACSTNH